ncbi:hypothetical protein Sjap_001538 [Stephania japonica]|uniref:Uncharacterized protein n=1 Tax=Stephania japonica TaxID=461633 RepID=A0AAP0PRK5_9MAGN
MISRVEYRFTCSMYANMNNSARMTGDVNCGRFHKRDPGPKYKLILLAQPRPFCDSLMLYIQAMSFVQLPIFFFHFRMFI